MEFIGHVFCRESKCTTKAMVKGNVFRKLQSKLRTFCHN